MITMRAGHMVLGARDCMAAGWVAGGFPWPRTPSWRRSETCPNLACVFFLTNTQKEKLFSESREENIYLAKSTLPKWRIRSRVYSSIARDFRPSMLLRERLPKDNRSMEGYEYKM